LVEVLSIRGQGLAWRSIAGPGPPALYQPPGSIGSGCKRTSGGMSRPARICDQHGTAARDWRQMLALDALDPVRVRSAPDWPDNNGKPACRHAANVHQFRLARRLERQACPDSRSRKDLDRMADDLLPHPAPPE
jgi:hypothetical protein